MGVNQMKKLFVFEIDNDESLMIVNVIAMNLEQAQAFLYGTFGSSNINETFENFVTSIGAEQALAEYLLAEDVPSGVKHWRA
jgi:hypothetical protein